MMPFSPQSIVVSQRFEHPFLKGMWYAFLGLLILLALFAGNTRASAAPAHSPSRLAPAASSNKALPQDISGIADKNDDISEVKQELLQMLEKNGQKSRDTAQFLSKMKEFLLLITENKLEYLRVLDDRLNTLEKNLGNSKLFTTKEIAEIRLALETDISFYEGKKTAIAAVKNWEDAKTISNEIQKYSDQALPRLRGFAGLRVLNEAMLLANQMENVSERLKKNLATLDSKVFDFQAVYSSLQSSIDSARENIQTAKAIYLNLIRNSGGKNDDVKAREALRAAQEDLKNARKASLEITIELMKAKQSSSGKK